jgi:hypothetical protein
MKYEIGHMDPWWDNSFKELSYQYLPHKDQDMVNKWVLQGYTNMNLNGAVCDIRGHVFAKRFVDFFNWANTGAALYQMNTGDTLPVHRDHYITYQKVFDITDTGVIWRAIVFMEDWKSGHYFEIDNTPVFSWRAGDFVVWNYDVPHMAANLGIEPRYTLQITGMKNVQ